MCTDLDHSLLFILILGTYSKFARNNLFLALGVCFPQPCSSAGSRFARSRSRLQYYWRISSFSPKKSMKCFVNWIPLRMRICSRNIQPHLKCWEFEGKFIEINCFRFTRLKGLPWHYLIIYNVKGSISGNMQRFEDPLAHLGLSCRTISGDPLVFEFVLVLVLVLVFVYLLPRRSQDCFRSPKIDQFFPK